MKPSPPQSLYGSVFDPQLAYLAVEQAPATPEEAKRLELLRKLINEAPETTDLRSLAFPAKKIMGAAYQLGTGAGHVWVKRADEPERLAIIADRNTTRYRDWNATAEQPPQQ